MASRLMRNFNDLKDKGMTNAEAMEKAMKLTAEGQERERASNKKLKRKRSSSKIKMAITGKASHQSHSPAGQMHLRRKKRIWFLDLD